ncbi:MAG: PEP-CTERM sorting domain-containing protein [Desulfobacterales bacterium]|nr:PEP-CTERM sorting domain-containing protein [Desulfobacterales bacterium]
MARLTKTTLCSALIALFFCAPALAVTFTMGDNYREWPGSETALNAQDAYGNPEILGAGIIIENGYLKQISIKFLAEQGIGLWYQGDFNSLFINSNGTGATLNDWDYYVRGYLPGAEFNSASSSEADFDDFETVGYSLSPANYAYTTPSSLSHAGGLLFRDDHPNGLEGVGSSLVPTAGLLASAILPDKDLIISGNTNTIEIQYIFSDNAIAMGSSFAVGFTPYSAGDVFLAPVPEPSAVFLIGTGIVSMGLCIRRKKKHSVIG